MKAKVLTVLIAMVLAGCSELDYPDAHYEDAVVTATTGLIGVVYGSNITLCYQDEVDLSSYEYLDSTYLYDDDGKIYVDSYGEPIVFPLYRFVEVTDYGY